MALRPVGYPYILVNSYELVDKNINKLNNDSDEFKNFLANAKIYRRHLLRQYAENKDVIKALKKYGFKPIEIAGEYSREVNFINAVVNKKQNGKMTYITNSSTVKGLDFYSKMQEMFEEELRQKVSDIKDVYFVKGNGNSVEFKDNCMMFTLRYGHGGIHCMSLEEPNFDIWA